MSLIESLVLQAVKGGSIPAELEVRLKIPEDRLAIYGLIADLEPHRFRHLLIRLFDEEIAFREALWNGITEDNGNFGECIYHCAFLIHCCGEPSDSARLWKAQYLNQDIGELEGFYFVGAGLDETLQYLNDSHDSTSTDIAAYIQEWSNHLSRESIAEWQQGRRQWLRQEAA